MPLFVRLFGLVKLPFDRGYHVRGELTGYAAATVSELTETFARNFLLTYLHNEMVSKHMTEFDASSRIPLGKIHLRHGNRPFIKGQEKRTFVLSRLESGKRPSPQVGFSVCAYPPKPSGKVWEISEWEPRKPFTWMSYNMGLRLTGTYPIESNDRYCVLKLDIIFDGTRIPIVFS